MMGKPTREQILAEPAGPRLDAWVAHALGYEVRTKPITLPIDGGEFMYQRDPGTYVLRYKDGSFAGHWRPSTPSAATWEVATGVPGLALCKSHDGLWTATVIIDHHVRDIVHDPCPAVAVCRAALLVWLAGEEEE